jgi:hypothetical protein
MPALCDRAFFYRLRFAECFIDNLLITACQKKWAISLHEPNASYAYLPAVAA